LLRRLDRDCDRFAASWRAGQRPRIEDYLDEVEGPERSIWLLGLLDLEVQARRSQGERPTPEEYGSRLPGHEAAIAAIFAESDSSALSDSSAFPKVRTARAATETAPPAEAADDSTGVLSGGRALEKLLRARALLPPSRQGTLARLGRFDVLEMIGGGGMGIVVLARDFSSGEQVAIKLLKYELEGSPRSIAQFRREAQRMALLEHPNILKPTEVDEHSEWPFFVMPYLAGGSLAARIAGRPMDHPAILV
jgi:hypothetical protein